MKMKLGLVVCAAAWLVSGCAGGMGPSDRIVILGDMAFVDGHRVPREEYDIAVANGTVDQLVQQVDARYAAPPVQIAAPAQVGSTVVAPVAVAPAPIIAGPRAAVCDTAHSYAAYPGDNALFNCNAGLGQKTRAQLLAHGWKVDMMEKTPVAGQATNQGAPLYIYQLVLSR